MNIISTKFINMVMMLFIISINALANGQIEKDLKRLKRETGDLISARARREGVDGPF